MKKIIVSLIIIVAASLILACSKEEYIKEKDIIKVDNITNDKKSINSDITKPGSKTEKFTIYFLDNNSSNVKYLPIDSNLSIENKINIIADTISEICFNDLPIIVSIDEKKVSVNLIESDESRKTWKDDFLDENNFEDTTLLLVKNLLQEDYDGEWIDTVQLAYEGEEIE